MFWRKQPKPRPEPPSTPVAQWIPPEPPEANIARAILDYQRHFSESLRHSVSADVEEAKRVVARANQIVGEGGLGPALAPTLLEHVKYWPSWSTHGDFLEYVNFPAEGISGTEEADELHRTKTTRVHFSYHGNPYTVVFVDEGMPQWTTDDLNAYGKVELI
jgi:hypothetical protein